MYYVVAFKLKANYRFDKDKEFDKLMDRYRGNEWTEEDIKTINSRMINAGTGVIIPNDGTIAVCYACARNKEQNTIATTILSRHVDEIHPTVKPVDDDYSACDGILSHIIILEGLIISKEGTRSEAFYI